MIDLPDAEVAERASAEIARWERGERHLLYLHFMAPHFPLDPSPEARARFGLGEQQAVLEVEARNHPLAEEEDVFGRQPEVPVALEEAPRFGIRGSARHHVPGQGPLEALPQPPDLLGLDLEEAALRDRADGKSPLGAGKTQPGILSSSCSNFMF